MPSAANLPITNQPLAAFRQGGISQVGKREDGLPFLTGIEDKVLRGKRPIFDLTHATEAASCRPCCLTNGSFLDALCKEASVMLSGLFVT
jgi:hypothetical protein